LRHPDAEVRRRAAHGLSLIAPDDPDTLRALVEALADPDNYVRLKAAWALTLPPGRAKPPPGYAAALAVALSDERREVCRDAAFLLADAASNSADPNYNDPDLARPAVPALREALRSRDAHVRIEAARALVCMDVWDDALVPALVESIDDKEEGYGDRALDVLNRIGPKAKDAVPVLVRSLYRRNGIAVRAYELLRKIGPSAVPALIPVVKDKHKGVRLLAISTLSEFGPEAKDAVPALIDALKDTYEGYFRDRNRASIAATLGGCGEAAAPAAPLLAALAKDANESDELRIACVRSLGKIGQAAQEILPTLAGLRDDPRVGDEVRRVLPLIEKDKP
jgi:HEAT repeat protein